MNKTQFLVSTISLATLTVLTGCASTPSKSEPASAASMPSTSSVAAVQTQPAPTLPITATNAPMPFEGDGWQVMFDGKNLDGWRKTDFTGNGQVEREADAVVFTMGDPFTGMNWTNAFPKINYEIALDAMRVSGSDFFLGLTVPVGDTFCSLIVGGWGGSLIGISSIDGLDASENETSKYDRLESGRWYRVRLRVTTNQIEAWIDNEKVINVVTAGRKISMRPGEIEMSKPLGLAAWQTAAAYREIRFREVTGPVNPAKARYFPN